MKKSKEVIIIDVEKSIFRVLEGRKNIDGDLDKKETEWTVITKVKEIVDDMINGVMDTLSCSDCPAKDECPILNEEKIVKGKAIAAGNLIYMEVIKHVKFKFDVMCDPMGFLKTYYDEFGKDLIHSMVISDYAVQLTMEARDKATCASVISYN